MQMETSLAPVPRTLGWSGQLWGGVWGAATLLHSWWAHKLPKPRWRCRLRTGARLIVVCGIDAVRDP